MSFLALRSVRTVERLQAEGGDGTIRLYDATTGQPQQILIGHTDYVRSVAFNTDGSTLASGSDDGTVRLWDTAFGVNKQTLIGHTDYIFSVAFSPDGNTLASGSLDSTVRLWDAVSGQPLQTLIGHKSGVLSVAFSWDGTFASGSSDGTVLLWELSPLISSYPTVRFSPSVVQSPAIGKRLTLLLNISNGVAVSGYQANVLFDTSALRYVESANGDYLSGDAFTVAPVVTGNSVTLAATSLTGESSGPGTLATVTFEVVAPKASVLTLSDVLLTNRAGSVSYAKVETGRITAPVLQVGDVNGDGTVNIQDLTLVAANFTQTGENVADINGDGIVNIVDLALVASALQNTASAPGTWTNNEAVLPTRAEVQQWLHEARQIALPDSAFQQGILVLQQLLEMLSPKETALLPNYPNPFNPETWIPYQLATPADVTLTIYTADGEVVRTLELGYQPIGIYRDRGSAAYWDGKNAIGESVASGVYFYTLKAGDFNATRKMLIRK